MRWLAVWQSHTHAYNPLTPYRYPSPIGTHTHPRGYLPTPSPRGWPPSR